MFVKNKGIKNKKSMICCYSDYLILIPELLLSRI